MEKKDTTVRIAAAANVSPALEEMVADFEERTGQKCEIISSSSGKLTAQIREGAPFDLLLSADRSYPDALYREGLTTGAPKIYAFGKLVLWSVSVDHAPDLDALLTMKNGKVAMAQPGLAPYGRATMQSLKYLGLEEAFQDKLIFGESIAQVNQFIASGAADYGFTSLSSVMTPTFSEQGKWVKIDESAYTPIEQAACLLQSETGPSEAAMNFYAYLFSDAARQILGTYGYELP